MNLELLLMIIAVQMALFVIAVFVVSVYRGVTLFSLLEFSPTAIISGFFVQLIGGPLGEEPAYRGFALPVMVKEHGVIKAGVITGFVWGLWHLPLWIISGYKGISLVLYIAGFLASIVAASIVMSIVATKNQNIIYPILIHQLVNFTLDILYTGDLLGIFLPMAVLYIIAMLVIVICYDKRK